MFFNTPTQLDTPLILSQQRELVPRPSRITPSVSDAPTAAATDYRLQSPRSLAVSTASVDVNAVDSAADVAIVTEVTAAVTATAWRHCRCCTCRIAAAAISATTIAVSTIAAAVAAIAAAAAISAAHCPFSGHRLSMLAVLASNIRLT